MTAAEPRPDVALITPYPAPGAPITTGVEWYAQGLARALRAEGASVAVLAPARAGCPTVQDDAGVRVRRCFSRGPSGVLRAAEQAVRTGAPVTHVQHEAFLFGGAEAVPGLIGGLARLRRAGVGPVVTMHQVASPGQVDRSFTEMHRVAMPPIVARAGLATLQGSIRRLAAKVIVHEPAFGRAVPGSEVVPIAALQADSAPAGAVVGAGGSGTAGGEARARAGALRSRHGLGHHDFVVLCFGFVAPYKGVELALAAAELAPPPVRVVVAGGEHPRLAGQRYLEGLKDRYGQRAVFTGYVPEAEVADWFSTADLALLPYPSVFSSSGVLALGMRHGVPCLLSRPVAELVGLPPHDAAPPDAEGLARRLSELAARGPALGRLVRQTEELGAGRSWPHVAKRHLEIYEEVTRARGADALHERPRPVG